MYKFYLNFLSDGFGKVEIDEIIGFSTTSFELKQKDKGYGRDIFFAGGESNFEFSYYRNHYLEKILYYNQKFGFESKVNLIIEVDGLDNLIGELDFATASTDDFQYFKCKVIQQGDLQIIKRNRETKVDLMSDLNADGVKMFDVYGNEMKALEAQNMLLLSKPIYQQSEWSQADLVEYESINLELAIPLVNNILKSEIDDTYLPLADINSDNQSGSELQMLKAKTKLTEVSIDIKNVKVHVTGISNQVGVMLRYGSDFATATRIRLHSQLTNGDALFTINRLININTLNENDGVWLYIYVLSFSYPTSEPHRITVEGSDIKIKTYSYENNSVTLSFRLVDVMRRVIKSISGLDINAPRFDVGGEFYDNRLFNGNLLRSITENGFKISLEDIDKSLPELNCDYEIAHDGRIFFGSEKDFYTNIECGFFDNTQFSSMNKMSNPKFTVNEFWFMYKRFQSLKEKEEVNSADVIHGESKLKFFNKRVENKKEVSVEWCRDAFEIEFNRRKSLEITESTASQNDEDLYAIDSIDTLNDVPFEDITEFQHTYISSNSLSLKTKGSVNFKSMGMTVGCSFTIKPPDMNSRNYTISEISNNELKLTRLNGSGLSSNENGIRLTRFTYTLLKETIPFTNYTNQNITAFEIKAGESFSNLRYSVGRNIWNYWKEYIATCNIYWKDKKLQNSWYKNNPKCSTVYQGKTIIEGGEFDTNGITPILSPFLYNDIIFANVELNEFLELQRKIRTDRGFIRCIDKTDKVIKVYPIDMKWEVSSKQLTIKGEEKYEPVNMTIDTSNVFSLINNETRLMNILWDIKDDKLSIYDINRQRLYNPVWWNNIAINDAIPISLAQLTEWLNLIP